MKLIMKHVNIKLWGLLGRFHLILNAPRILCIYIIGVYHLMDLLGKGGEHTFIRKTLKHFHLYICNLKY